MSTTGLIVPYSLTSLQIKPSWKSQTPIFNPIYVSETSKPKFGFSFLVNRGLKDFSNDQKARSVVVYGGILPAGAPLPSEPPHSWKSWVLGAIITIMLPFLRHKWGPLFKLTKEVEAVVETVEQVTEAIEKVAEEVEKVAEEVADNLPDGGKLRDAVEFIDNAAKGTAKAAHFAEEIIDKVEEVEKEVESFMEPANVQAINEIARDKNDQTQTTN